MCYNSYVSVKSAIRIQQLCGKSIWFIYESKIKENHKKPFWCSQKYSAREFVYRIKT